MTEHLTNKHFKHLKEQFQCEECGKKYNQSYSLTVHMRKAHSNGVDTVKSICSKCGKEFSSRHERNQHESRVHAPATLTCSECPPGKDGQKRKYSEKKLKDHILDVHRKSFKCPKCDQKRPQHDTQGDPRSAPQSDPKMTPKVTPK